MTRRSSPQRRIDDEAFPVRVKLLVPEGGFGRRLTELHVWLDREAGRGEYAFHAASTLGIPKGAVAVYFWTPATAHRFVGSFPDLLLADGTDSVVYTSPHLPSGQPSGRRSRRSPRWSSASSRAG
jgi:hypothetical protein